MPKRNYCKELEDAVALIVPNPLYHRPKKEVDDMTLKELLDDEWWDNATIIDVSEAIIYVYKISEKINNMNNKLEAAINKEKKDA